MKSGVMFANMPATDDIRVIKNNGVQESFNMDKLIKSLILVDTPLWAAEKIATTIASKQKMG
jgi:ribonucleoside-triphosphate reductase